jgi:general secretion pathway protein I
VKRAQQRARGFSLLETVVALVILSISLGMLYRATAGATRNVRINERYTYAVVIAESLLDNYRVLGPGGVNEQQQLDDFRWQVSSRLLPGEGAEAAAVPLHELSAVVSWDDGMRTREVALVTVVPESTEPPLTQ